MLATRAVSPHATVYTLTPLAVFDLTCVKQVCALAAHCNQFILPAIYSPISQPRAAKSSKFSFALADRRWGGDFVTAENIQKISLDLESVLRRSTSNFELEITLTQLMTMNEPLVKQDWYNEYSYHCHLLLAKGFSEADS